MSLSAIVAEDEQIAREAICAMARACDIDVVAECKDGPEAIRSLQKRRANLLFLDVQMPGIDGFGVLQQLTGENLPAIIFTTAYDCYAVKAFEHNAADYLLKPFDEERFRNAVERAKSQLEYSANHAELISRLVSELNQFRRMEAAPQRIVIRSRGYVEFLRVDEIDWIEASHNYLKIHAGREVHSLRQTMAEIESRLQPDKFLRIHRSLIVNVDRIRRLEACGYGEYLVVLRDGKTLSLSRGYRDRLDGLVERIVGGDLSTKRSLRESQPREH
jgi:two-component system, LytTR family, response regulator